MKFPYHNLIVEHRPSGSIYIFKKWVDEYKVDKYIIKNLCTGWTNYYSEDYIKGMLRSSKNWRMVKQNHTICDKCKRIL